MRRIILLSVLALLLFIGLPHLVAARNNGIQSHRQNQTSPEPLPSGQVQPSIGFNGGGFADGGRSPFGQ